MISQIIGSKTSTKEVEVAGENVLLSTGIAGALRAEVRLMPPSTALTKNRRNYCGCGDCYDCAMFALEESNTVKSNPVRIDFNIASYSKNCDTVRQSVCLPSIEHFNILAEFFAQVKLSKDDDTVVEKAA